jgi:hypothetical protein
VSAMNHHGANVARQPRSKLHLDRGLSPVHASQWTLGMRALCGWIPVIYKQARVLPAVRDWTINAAQAYAQGWRRNEPVSSSSEPRDQACWQQSGSLSRFSGAGAGDFSLSEPAASLSPHGINYDMQYLSARVAGMLLNRLVPSAM